MIRSALKLAISSLVVALAVPLAHAAGTTKSPAKKTAQKKIVKKAVQKRAAARKAASRKTHAKSAARKSRSSAQQAHRKTSYRQASFTPAAPALPPASSAGDADALTHDALSLRSNAAVVVDQVTSKVLFEKNSSVPLPIASLTKLMTAMVVLDAQQDLEEILEVTADDVDHIKNTGSRLRIGSRLSRADMLHIALMSSENRAASTLGRNYPGGLPAFVAAMNTKAKTLGMFDTRYVEPTGLSSQNMASARDLAKLVAAASEYPLIRKYSTDEKYAVHPRGHALQYISSNRLVLNSDWEIGLQKTGYINEAGHCLVMQASISGRPVVMVLLDSKGKYSRFADADRVRKWVQVSKPQLLTQAALPQS
jgi:D-alanyl-D-alanine endopeptidase (penicillin-binding protein 7)